MKIRRRERIKNFNWRYKKIYNNLPKIYQTFITVEGYADSIIYRPYTRSQVIIQRCFDLEDAFEEAELAERAEEVGDATNEQAMTTIFNSQPFYYKNSIHPFNNLILQFIIRITIKDTAKITIKIIIENNYTIHAIKGTN